MNRRVAGPLLALVLLAASCTGPALDRPGTGDGPPPGAAPFEDCPAYDTPPPPSDPTAPIPAGRSDAGPEPGGSGPPMPAVSLECFTGGGSVDLGALRGPAVVNLWASWCTPCRKELPALQRLHERAAGRIHVIGVDTRDQRGAAESVGTDLDVTFPQLLDPRERLLQGLQRRGLPITVFVDEQGRIRHLDESGGLDDETLTALVARHLAVTVES
nr:TlpA disulfide reductase family protein [Micromonospora sp. DSM 115978]